MDLVGCLFTLSGFMNTCGLMVFNRGFVEASTIASHAPTVFSIESQLLIMLWGMAYASVARQWKDLPYLSLVFCIEKLLFVIFGSPFLFDASKRGSAIDLIASQEDILTGLFLLLAPVNDLLFALVFGYAAMAGFQESKKSGTKQKMPSKTS